MVVFNPLSAKYGAENCSRTRVIFFEWKLLWCWNVPFFQAVNHEMKVFFLSLTISVSYFFGQNLKLNFLNFYKHDFLQTLLIHLLILSDVNKRFYIFFTINKKCAKINNSNSYCKIFAYDLSVQSLRDIT